MADRYMYLPSIGLLIAAVWWAGDVLRDRPRLVPAATALVGAILLALSIATWRLQPHWQNTFALFQKSLQADPDNWLGHNMVARVYAANGERAIDLGDAAQGRRFFEMAADHNRRSLARNPRHYVTLHNQAWSLHQLGRYDESIEHFRRSIEINPTFGYSHLYLGVTYAKLDRVDDALRMFEEAARVLPNNPDVEFHWAEALLKFGRKDDAVEHLRRTLRVSPDHQGAKYWLERATAPTTFPATAPAIAPATRPG
jgi:tetratricopeptide (TPR) repeat protein